MGYWEKEFKGGREREKVANEKHLIRLKPHKRQNYCTHSIEYPTHTTKSIMSNSLL